MKDGLGKNRQSPMDIEGYGMGKRWQEKGNHGVAHNNDFHWVLEWKINGSSATLVCKPFHNRLRCHVTRNMRALVKLTLLAEGIPFHASFLLVSYPAIFVTHIASQYQP